MLRAVASGGSSSIQGQFNVTTYGALGDGRVLTDVTTTNGSPVISSASYQFQKSDEGKLIAIAGAGAAAAYLNSSIASVSAGIATLNNNAGTSKAGNATATFGTDDTVAIQATVTAAAAAAQGGIVVLNKAIYITNTITWASLVSMQGQGAGKSILYFLSTSDMTSAVIQGTAGSTSTPYIDCQFSYFEIDGSSAKQATYTVAGKGFFIQYMVRPKWFMVYVHDTPATCFGVDYLAAANIDCCIAQNGGRLNNGTSDAGGAGFGIAVASGVVGTYTLESTTVSNCFALNNKRFGIFFETAGGSASVASKCRAIGNFVNISATGKYGIGDCGTRDFVISSNTIVGTSGCLDGIVINGGTIGSPGGQGVIIGNDINTCANGIGISYSTAPSSFICKYTITGNRIDKCTAAGMEFKSNASTVTDTINVTGNTISLSGTAGISFVGAAGFKDVSLKSNISMNNAQTTVTASLKAGISITSPITRLRMVGNDCFDNQGSQTQAYGLIVDTVAVTGALIQSNDFSNNLTGSISLTTGGTIAGTLLNNLGYNSVGRVTAQTAAAASIATITVPASDSSYRVSANALVTASTTHSFTITCAYTDEGNTARTLTFPVSQLVGTIITAITNVTGAGPYEGVPLHIRCKAGTTITIATTGTFTSVTYNAEAYIEQLMT